MRVGELKLMLEEFKDEDIVVLSKDAEGNDFSPLYDGDRLIYRMITTYNGECFNFDDYNSGCIEKQQIDQVCLCLWPEN